MKELHMRANLGNHREGLWVKFNVVDIDSQRNALGASPSYSQQQNAYSIYSNVTG